MKALPNFFTLLNLFFGTLAIVFILQTGESIVVINDGLVYQNLPEKMVWGSVCIGIAAIIDFLDGFVARLVKVSSPLGKQLDSLADVVSFGVAPGLIMYQLLRMSFAAAPDGLEVLIIWLLPAFIIPCAGAYRLARFNLDESQTYYFKGVPIPAGGLLIASFPLILHFQYSAFAQWSAKELLIESIWLSKWFLYSIILLVSYLMVSTIPLMAMKFTDYSIKNNLPKIILLLASIVSIIFFKWIAIPIIFILYLFVSIVFRKKIVPA